MSPSVEEVRAKLKAAGQEHLLQVRGRDDDTISYIGIHDEALLVCWWVIVS